jgi:ABC-2 type transport system permease protein
VPLLRKALLDDLRWHVVGYALGLGVWGALVVAIYPTFRDSMSELELPSWYADFLGTADWTTARNFLQLELFTWAPLLLIVYCIVAATGVLAGDEQRGTLELVLAQPVARARVYAERAGAVALGAALVCAGTSVGLLLALPFVDLPGLPLPELLAAPFGMLPLALFFVALACCLGTLLPTRGAAAGLSTAVAVAGYIALAVADLAEGLDGLRYVTPFYYADQKQLLTEGVVWWHQALLVGSTLALFALGLRAFDRRELGVGRSPWRALLRRAG